MTEIIPFPPRVNGTQGAGCAYDDSRGCIVWNRLIRTKNGEAVEMIELANFKARIISDILRDDGVEQTRHYEIAATLGKRPFRFTVPAARFTTLAWVAARPVQRRALKASIRA